MKKVTRSAVGNQKARQVLAHREKLYSVLFTALDKRASFDPVIGWALRELTESKIPKAELAELTGLTHKQIADLMATAPDDLDEQDTTNKKDDEKQEASARTPAQEEPQQGTDSPTVDPQHHE